MIRFVVSLTLLAVISAANAQRQTCPNLYKRFDRKHSYCLDPNPQCLVQVTGVNQQEKELILRMHNEFRSKIAMGQEKRAGGMPQASNMLEMIWDNDLADVAQKWSENCIFEHDCHTCRRVKAFGVGQNIGSNYMFWKLGDRGDWQTFLEHLYDEVKSPAFWNDVVDQFRPGPPALDPDQYGHFTQLIWAESWRVGCGYAKFNMGGRDENLLVCNYGPSGNMAGQKIYERGQPCSACPKNTCCGSACSQHNLYSPYKGLCKVINPALPPLPYDNRQYLYNCDFNLDCFASKTNDYLWKFVQTPGGNWESVVLRGGQKTRITLQKKFYPQGNVCLYTYVRGGPNVEGQTFGLAVTTNIHTEGRILPMDISGFLAQFPNRFRHTFIPLQTGMPMYGETQFSFDVSVPVGASDQFFEVQKVIVLESRGRCPVAP